MSDIVEQKSGFQVSDLWKLEDYWAIWLGFSILCLGLILFLGRPPEEMKNKIHQANLQLSSESERAPFKTIEWYQANDIKKNLKATSHPVAKRIKQLLGKPHEILESCPYQKKQPAPVSSSDARGSSRKGAG